MKKAALAIVMLNFAFVFIIALSSYFTGVISTVIYYLAFIVPIVAYFACRSKAKIELSPPRFTISGENARLGAPLVFPTIAVVFVISFITSLIVSKIGVDSVTDVSGNLATVILTKALLTAILEEMLFRYIPLSVLSPHSRRGAVILSATFFALAHCNLYQLFYAFVAGVILAVADLLSDSILPSVVIHFLNNLVSIFWLRYGASETFSAWYTVALLSLGAISVIPIVVYREKYKSGLARVFRNDGRIEFTLESTVFALMMLALTILSI